MVSLVGSGTMKERYRTSTSARMNIAPTLPAIRSQTMRKASFSDTNRRGHSYDAPEAGNAEPMKA